MCSILTIFLVASIILGDSNTIISTTSGHVFLCFPSISGHVFLCFPSTSGHVFLCLPSTSGHVFLCFPSISGHVFLCFPSTSGHVFLCFLSTSGHVFLCFSAFFKTLLNPLCKLYKRFSHMYRNRFETYKHSCVAIMAYFGDKTSF